MTVRPEAIRASYAACHRVTRRAGSSFTPCFLVLRQPKRRAMEALYAFMRHTDDLGDSPAPGDCRREALAQWRASLQHALNSQGEARSSVSPLPLAQERQGATISPLPSAGEGQGVRAAGDRVSPSEKTPHATQSPHPSPLPKGEGTDAAILPAVADTVRRFGIPEEHLHAVIDGVEMDLDTHRYETFDELAVYCHRVASAVGLACIHVWGFRGQEAVGPARACGIALQLTNILRDLKEDAAHGRVYLPLEDLRACGYPAEDLVAGVLDARLDRLMALEIDRAERFYREGAELLDWLEPGGRRIGGMMIDTYHRLLLRIKRRPREVFARRVRLGRFEKLRIAARWALLPPRRLALP